MMNHLQTESVIGEIYSKNIDRNAKLDYWHDYLNKSHALEDNFKFMGISLWDVFIGTWAVEDLFEKATNRTSVSKQTSFLSRVITIRNLCKRGLRSILTRNICVGKVDVVFMAFERRQISCYLEALNLLKGEGRLCTTITTNMPSHEWPTEFINGNHNVTYLEGALPIKDYHEVFLNYRRILRWLQSLMANSLCKESRFELNIIINNIKKKLLYVLLLIKFSQKMFELIKPAAVVGADISDMRSRAVFLTAKKLKIPTYHTPYGYFSTVCFEERYLAADKKLVYSAKHKDLLIKHFGLREESIKVIGCPRFDSLFKLRKRVKRKRPPETLKILIGTQPLGNTQTGSFAGDVKMNALERFFKFIKSDCVKVLLKPHPDEGVEEIEAVRTLVKNMGIEIDVVKSLDFNTLVNEIDLFVTFYSMLSLEFMILGIPVCFLVSVQDIPVFNSACEKGIAMEVLRKKDWDDCKTQIFTNRESFMQDSEEFLKSEFTKIDGTSSIGLVNICCKKNIKTGVNINEIR